MPRLMGTCVRNDPSSNSEPGPSRPLITARRWSSTSDKIGARQVVDAAIVPFVVVVVTIDVGADGFVDRAPLMALTTAANRQRSPR